MSHEKDAVFSDDMRKEDFPFQSGEVAGELKGSFDGQRLHSWVLIARVDLEMLSDILLLRLQQCEGVIMVTIRGCLLGKPFSGVLPGELFLSPTGEFATGLSPQCPLDGATLYLKRSDTVVAAFGHQGITSYPVGSDYWGITVVIVPFPRLIRMSNDELQGALGMLTQPLPF